MSYELIIFDMDGTILDTLKDLQAAVNFSMRKHGFPEKTYEEMKWLLGRGMPYLIHHALPEGTDEETYQKAFDDFLDYYAEHAEDTTAPYEGIPEAVKALKDAGYKVAVNSNKNDREVGVLAEHYFPGLFDFVLGSRPEIEKKPSPEGVNLIEKEFGVDKSKTIYIGDSDIDLQTALNSEVQFIGCHWGFRGKEFLLKNGAKYVAEKPADLLKIVQSL